MDKETNKLIKEIYLGELKWTKTHDNMGGVMGNFIFKDNVSYEDYQKLFKNIYFVLCNKDYITNLQEEVEDLKKENKLLKIHLNVMKQDGDDTQDRIDKAIEVLKLCNSKCSKEVIDILRGEINESNR